MEQAQDKQNVFQGSGTVYQVHVRTLLCVGLSESMCTNARRKERRNLSEIVTANFQHSGVKVRPEPRSFVTTNCNIVAIVKIADYTSEENNETNLPRLERVHVRCVSTE